jgi:hypothetical protein
MSELIGAAKMLLNQTKARVLDTFAHVPDDKLTWSPDPQAKTPLRIVAHCAVSNFRFASFARGNAPAADTVEKAVALQEADELAITTRAEAVAQLEKSTADLLAAIDSLTPEQLAGSAELPGRAIPMSTFIFLGARHLDSHAAQIDYLQTTWGDQMNHFGIGQH